MLLGRQIEVNQVNRKGRALGKENNVAKGLGWKQKPIRVQFMQRKVPIRLMNWKTNEDDVAAVPIKGGGLTGLAWLSG